MIRPDAPLVRHIAETHGQRAAAYWQAAPYVLLPGEGFADYAVRRSRDLARAMPVVETLPWDDATFEYPVGLEPLVRASVEGLIASGEMAGVATEGVREMARHLVDAERRGRCWIRVAAGERYVPRAAERSPWLAGSADLLAPFRRHPERYLAIECWEERTHRPGGGGAGLPAYPDVTIVPRGDPWTMRGWAHLYPNPACRTGRAFGDGTGFCNIGRCQFPEGDRRLLICSASNMRMGLGAILTLCTLAYLAGCDEYLVEVTPILSERQRRQHARRGAGGGDKPWTREDLPHFILVDPRRARDYGARRPDEGGSHASPAPHSRRGHWRELRAERFARGDDGEARRVWIKPQWIGSFAWEASGAAYKVVPPRVV